MVVVVNYRLGPQGWFSHPELSAEEGGSSGNQGLDDQSRALRWVKRNAFVFGGDPERITLWGQGAGGVSALLQVAAPRSTGRFRSVVAWSGSIDTAAPSVDNIEVGLHADMWSAPARNDTGQLPSLQEAEAAGVAFALAAGCLSGPGQLACLRSLSAM